MAGIGYRPKFFEKYFRVVEKAELHGNPIIERFPDNHKDIHLAVPAHVEAMKEEGLIPEHATDGDVFASIATLKLASMYLRRGVQDSNIKKRHVAKNSVSELPITSCDDEYKELDVMLAARKGYIGKCNKGKCECDQNV